MNVFRNRTRLSFTPFVLAFLAAGCGSEDAIDAADDGQDIAEGAEATVAQVPGETDTSSPPSDALLGSVVATLVPRAGVSGQQRINFAVPLKRGLLSDVSLVRVLRAGVELPAGRRALAKHPDGSIRSVQVQFDLQISGQTSVEVRLGETPTTGSISLVPVANTLGPSNGAEIPRVWATLPAAWLSESGAFGPQVTEASVAGTALDPWNTLCNYEKYNLAAFLAKKSDATVWLFDRGTTMYRGYARQGDLTATLTSAYHETSIYRLGITGTGTSTKISIPGKASDLKYYYTQNMAIHYLLTGDDRFRESAEQIAFKMKTMWDPWYDGGFWTERHAGFLLLGYLWASLVSDDKAAQLALLADDTVAAVLEVQNENPPGYTNQNARCFAHSGGGGWGCSPWMSAILADGLDAYATERSGTPKEAAAKQALVKLGRMIAQQGRDNEGRPYYWLGIGSSPDEKDNYDEHWGEGAYVVAMAWYHGGKQEPALKQAANELTNGFDTHGEVPHMRSFNWQCRSAVATPYYLK